MILKINYTGDQLADEFYETQEEVDQRIVWLKEVFIEAMLVIRVLP